MAILDYVERALSRMLKNKRGNDNKLFTRGPAFAAFPDPTIKITSEDCGESGARLEPKYTQFGASTAPRLTWATPSPDVKQYLLLCEDPDSPHESPSLHGLWYAIPGGSTTFKPADIVLVDDDAGGKKLNGSLKLGKNRRGTVFTGPRPLFGHGEHRYFWELVALKEEVNEKNLSPVPTKEELAAEIMGKVSCWGQWIGVYETKKEDLRKTN